jgi:hypothetical protein
MRRVEHSASVITCEKLFIESVASVIQMRAFGPENRSRRVHVAGWRR